MAGDNPSADVRGAEQCGIPAILVRKSDATIRRQREDLKTVQHVIESTQQDAWAQRGSRITAKTLANVWLGVILRISFVLGRSVVLSIK